MQYHEQKYRVPTPPQNPKALNYKEEGKMLKFKQSLDGLAHSQDPEE